MSRLKKKKYVVIGAGYTGLVSALRLAQKGHGVTVLERESSIGGLASDFTVGGGALEKAYHHIFKSDTSIISLAHELGISGSLKWHDSSIAIFRDNKLYPFKGALDLLRFSPLRPVNRLRAGLVVLYLQQTRNWQKFEKTSAYHWMLRYAGPQVTEVIWEPLLRGKFDQYYDKVSMAWLWARIHVRAQSREAGGEKLGYFDGGFRVFTDALVAKLTELGVDIHTNTNIDHIKSLKSGRVSIVLDNNSSTTYDGCIASIPSHVFSRLIRNNKTLSSLYLDKLSSTQYLGARLMVFSSDQDLTPYYWHNINDLNLPFLVFINHTKLIDKSFYANRYVYYVAVYTSMDNPLFTCTDQELEASWVPAIKKVFPSFDEGLMIEKYFFRFANAQHIVGRDYSSSIPDHKTPLPNIYLANFSQIYPEDRGTNYAVRDGNTIADMLTSEA